MNDDPKQLSQFKDLQDGLKLPFKILRSRLGFVYENPVKWAIGGYREVSDYIAGDDRIMKFVFQ